MQTSLDLLHEKVDVLFFFFSSSTYRNCSFPMECLKNSLQILCIYAQLLNSAVLLFIFYFIWCFWCYPVAVRPLPLPHVDLPARRARRCSTLPLGPAQVPPFIYALFNRGNWGGSGGAQPIPRRGPNPAPSQKTPNAPNWHLISSPGAVGPCDAPGVSRLGPAGG